MGRTEIWAKIFLILSVITLLFVWLYTAFTYFDLPDIIPVHFGLNGTPDGFGSKNLNWFLALITTGDFLLCFYISKNIDSPLLNNPNSLRNNKPLAELFINVLMFVSMLMFANITYESTVIAMGNAEKLGWTTLALIVAIFVIMFGFFMYASKVEKKENLQ